MFQEVSFPMRLARRLEPRIYYGWIVVGTIFVANTAAFAINPTFGLFVSPLEHEFGWDRAALARSLTLGTVAGAIVSPLLGTLSDRIGVRKLIVICGTLAALCFVGLSRIDQAWQFNLLIGLSYAFMCTGVGSVLGSVAVSHWFVRRRGRAMGIVMMGASSSGLVFVLLHTLLIATVGWRNAFLIQGALTLAMIAVPAWALLIDRPESIGASEEVHPARDSEMADTSGIQGAPVEGEHSWTLREALRTRAFWMTLCGVMLGSFPVIGYFAHAVPILVSHGVPAGYAATAWAVFFTTGIMAKFVWGFAIERLSVRYSLAICFAAEAVGLVMLSRANSVPMAFAWAVFNGLGHGPYLQLLAMVWADYFGRRSLGAIFGAVQPLIVLSASLGPWVAGLLYDRNGTYLPFLVLAIAMTLASGVVFLLDMPPRRPRAPVALENS